MADKLGVESIVLQVKGAPAPQRSAAQRRRSPPSFASLALRSPRPGALGSIIATIRSSGINAARHKNQRELWYSEREQTRSFSPRKVTQAYVRNTIQYGGRTPDPVQDIQMHRHIFVCGEAAGRVLCAVCELWECVCISALCREAFSELDVPKTIAWVLGHLLCSVLRGASQSLATAIGSLSSAQEQERTSAKKRPKKSR